MTLIELVVFGIRNFTQVRRLTLRPGINQISGPSGSGKSTISELLSSLFDPGDALLIERFGNPKLPKTCQFGTLLRGRDGVVYRFVRDLVAGKVQLSKTDESGKFRPESETLDAARKIAMASCDGLAPEQLFPFFTLNRSRMPSSRPTRTAAPKPSFPESATIPVREAPALPVQDRQATEKRLTELRAVVARAESLSGLEDQLADLQGKLAQKRRTARTVAEKLEEIAQIEESGASRLKGLDLPDRVGEMLEELELQERVRMDRLQQFEEEIEIPKLTLSSIPITPIYLNRFLIAGAAVILISITIAIFLPLDGLLRNLFLISLAGGIGLAGYALWQDATWNSNRKRAAARIRDLERQREAYLTQYRRDNQQSLDLIERSGAGSIAGFRELLREREGIAYRRQNLEQDLSRFLAGGTPEALEAETQSLAAKLAEIENRLKSEAPLDLDLYTVQEEIRRLESPLMTPEREASDPGPLRARETPILETVESFLDPEWQAALAGHPVRDRILADRESYRSTIESYIQATGLGFRMNVNEGLEMTLETSDGKPVPFSQLPSGHRDLLFFAWYGGFMEFLSKTIRLPILLDDPLRGLDSASLNKALDILKRFAQNKQALLFSQTDYAVGHTEQL